MIIIISWNTGSSPLRISLPSYLTDCLVYETASKICNIPAYPWSSLGDSRYSTAVSRLYLPGSVTRLVDPGRLQMDIKWRMEFWETC